MQLTFSEYDILNLSREPLLISSNGVSKINSLQLLSVLQELKTQHGTSIKKTLFNKIISDHKLAQKETYLFLENAIGLKPRPAEIYFKKVLITHDWKDHQELKTIINQELKCEHAIILEHDTLVNYAKNKAYFIKIICTEYNYAKLKKLYFDLADSAPLSAICVGYLSGGLFHISQPYIASVGNPCHFCTIERQINYERRKNTQNNWSALLSFCSERNIATPSQNLTLLQRSLALGAIVQKIKLHTEHGAGFRHQDNTFTSTTIDLSTGAITEELSPHWHSCNCLRSKNEKYTA